MTFRMGIVAGALVLATAASLGAQEPGPPQDRRAIERLERLRFERLHEALGLTEEQAATIHEQMERSHAAMRESFQRQKEAMEALERDLAATPIDEDALRRSLAEVEAARAQMESERERHVAELARTLTTEQRARFLLFNRQFDTRLRELVDRHHGRGHGGGRGRLEEGRPEATREERIQALERRIGEMQRELQELKAGGDD